MSPIRLWTLTLILAFSASCGSAGSTAGGNGTPLSDSALKSFQACSTGLDCTVATNGCCSCTAAQVGIAQNQIPAFTVALGCGETFQACPMCAPASITNFVADCVNHLCQIAGQTN